MQNIKNCVIIFKLDFRFCRMYIYINSGLFCFKKNEEGWKMPLLDKIIVCFKECLLKIGASEKPSVCKEVLVTRSFSGILRLADVSLYFDNSCINRYLYKLFSQFPSQYRLNSETEIGRRQVVNLNSVIGEMEMEIRAGNGNPCKFSKNLSVLGSI